MASKQSPPARRSLSERLAKHDEPLQQPGDDRRLRFFFAPLGDVRSNRENARVVFDEGSLDELTESIRRHGVIEPITLRRLPDEEDAEASYEVVAGERRFRASQRAGKTHIPAVLRTDDDHVAISLVENLQREDLNPMEEAMGLQHLIETESITKTEAAERLGVSRTRVSKSMQLLQLHDEVKRAVLGGADVARSHLYEIAAAEPAHQVHLWRSTVQGVSIQQLRHLRRRLEAEGSAVDGPKSAPSKTRSYFHQVRRRLSRIPADLENATPEERARATEELETLLETIEDVLKSVRRA